MIPLTADETLNRGRDPTEVGLADVLRHAAQAENSRDVRVLRIRGHRNPPVDAEFHTADDQIAAVVRVHVVAVGGEVRRLLVRVSSNAHPGIRNDSARLRGTEPVAGRHLERRDRRRQRNAQRERLPVVDERPLAALLEPGDADLHKQTVAQRELGAAAEERPGRLPNIALKVVFAAKLSSVTTKNGRSISFGASVAELAAGREGFERRAARRRARPARRR